MLTVDVYGREELADAVEKIEEDTHIILHHKSGVTHFRFSPASTLQYYLGRGPGYFRHPAIRQARRFSAVAAYLEHLKQLAKRIRKMPLRTFT